MLSHFSKSSFESQEQISYQNLNQKPQDQENLKELNFLFKKLPERDQNYHTDILYFFDEEYTLENGQNHHKTHSYTRKPKANAAVQNQSESFSSPQKQSENHLQSESLNLTVQNKDKIEIETLQAQNNSENLVGIQASDKKNKSEIKKTKLNQQELFEIQMSGEDSKKKEDEKKKNKFWDYFHYSTNKLVHHQNLSKEQEIYHPSDIEIENKYFFDQYSKIPGWKKDTHGKQIYEKDIHSWQSTSL